MSEILNHPKSWTLTMLERELRDSAAGPPLSQSRLRVLRWLSQLPSGEAEILWGRSSGLSWAALAAEHDGVNESSIAHRLYMPALEHLRTIATLDTFERKVASCSSALVDAGRRLDRGFDKIEVTTQRLGTSSTGRPARRESAQALSSDRRRAAHSPISPAT